MSLGEGVAFVILESKKHALKRHAHMYTEVLGYGLSNDAHHPTAPDVDGSGVAKSISMALINAKASKNNIDYI